MSELPIDTILPELGACLERSNMAILVAPPGAGKTTRVPGFLLDAPWRQGRIVMLEPRRLAARSAAERLAAQLGEMPGGRVGYRIRGESRVSPATLIEVVTEGVLTRMIQSDPGLEEISALLFDEIHERSLAADLGLALARDIQEALRPDLRILAMSATVDAARFSALLGNAPVVESAGRRFPVETRWLPKPWRRPGARSGPRFEEAVADLVRLAAQETLAGAGSDTSEGDILVFLPGIGEIRRVAGLLKGSGEDVDILELHGGLSLKAQREVLQAGQRRRIVLATSIAETSLTLEGITVVVDGGRARRSRQSPATGMTRLVTEPVSRAEADQRRGRAGRTAPGICYRLWTKGEEGALPAFAPPEMLTADLTPLALELAQWGVTDPRELAFLDQPPEGALSEGRALLARLGALADGRITAHGERLLAQPMHPRLAHMLEDARGEGLEAEAALIAALLGERDPLRAASGADIASRLAALLGGPAEGMDRDAAERIRREARRIAGRGAADRRRAVDNAGALLARAYPDRIGLRRPGDAPRYLLSGGRGAVFRDADPLGGQRLIVAADLEDSGKEALIRLAAPLTEAELRAAFPDQIETVESVEWSRRHRRVEARRREMFGALALTDQNWSEAPPERLGAALADGIRDLGLEALDWPRAAQLLRKRIAWLREAGEDFPDWSDPGLIASLDDWLVPHLAGRRSIGEIAGLDLAGILRNTLDWESQQRLDRLAPAHFVTPLGSRVAIDYGGVQPSISLRVQELFGVTEHPHAAGQPLLIELLSPASRPVQMTQDLPGFWQGSYRDVAKDMRARYPKHPWPDDPAAAPPTRRAKPGNRGR